LVFSSSTAGVTLKSPFTFADESATIAKNNNKIGYSHMQAIDKSLAFYAIAALSLILSACTPQTPSSEQTNTSKQMSNASSGLMLTNEMLYQDYEYRNKRPGAIRWDKEGSKFTALETAEGFEDAELEKDQYGDDIKIYEEIVHYDPATLERSILISLAQLTPKGSDKALVVDDYQWSKDQSRLLIYTNAKYVWRDKTRGEYWVLNIEDGELWKLGEDSYQASQMMFGKFSPDSTKFAYVYLNNIYVQDLQSRDVTALTTDASETTINGLFDWAYEEEFSIQDGFRWGPDSQRIAYWQLDTSAAQDFYIINNTDTLYPTITAIPYPKVGEENSAARIGVVSIANSETQWIELPGIAKDMYVPRMSWVKGQNQVLIQQMNRKQDTNTIFYADADTGEIEQVFVEQEETYIEYLEDPIWLDNSDAFLWLSERSGWKHIYKVSRDGKSLTDLTPGDFDVTDFVAKDEANNWLYFIASPENPTQRYLYRTSLDGSGDMTRITPAAFSGTNSYNVSADAKWAIHTHSSFLQPPVYTLISLPDHQAHNVLEDNAELVEKIAQLAKGDFEFYSVNSQDGLSLDGYIMRPPNMDTTKQYPIIHFVYGEPASQIVRDMWLRNTMWHMMMTQQGFIVSSVDNRGTPSPKGRDWRRSVYGNVGPLGARDQSDALKEMCKRWQYIDCSKVGVWGHSGGGSMTLNLLFRYPEQFHVGVSRAPVPDQRLYDSIYQERYSGLLEDFEANYIEASPITHAKNLQGKLLLVHGTGDDNVHYQGAERLINELVKHNRQFDLMSYPNRRHGIVEGEGTSLHLHTLQSRYFIEHLKE
jgi:dipeptidyl-peptidase-4